MKDDEIKEILNRLEKIGYYASITKELAYMTTNITPQECKQILDYITNLQQAFENSYTEEQLDFAVNEVKDQLKAEQQLTNQLRNEIDKLRVKNYELQQENEQLRTQVNTYENPDDLTLFYMWLDEKAKDKMKHMENEIRQLKQFNQMLTEMGEDYKSRVEKANEFINENTELEHDGDDYGYMEWINIINMDIMTFINNLSDILNGRSDENERKI